MKRLSRSSQVRKQPTRFVLLCWVVLTTLALTQTAFTCQNQAKHSSETVKDSKQTQTAFTYQGQLKEGSVPANGAYTFRFALYTGQSGGQRLGIVIKDDVVVTNGSFAVQLDFGSDGVSTSESWIEVAVRPARSAEAYAALSPRQRLTPTPYAILAQAEPWSLIGVPVGFQRGAEADLVPGDKTNDDVSGAKTPVKSGNSPKDGATPAAGDNVTITPGGNASIAAQGDASWTNDNGVVRLATDTDTVGIGIKEPTAKLDVDGSIRARGAIRSGNSMTFNGLDHTITATDVLNQLFSKQIRIGFSNTPTPDPVTFPDIKVGIGTLTPGATLHVDQPNVPNGGEAARVTFQNLIDQQTAIGINAVESAVKNNRGGHIGVNAQTSIDFTQGPQKGGALGRLAQSSGFFAGGNIIGVLGQSTPSALTNAGSTNISFGVGGLFTGGPASGTLTLDANGAYWVGGVYGQVSGAVNTTPGAGAVAGVIGVDTNTGTAASYAGYFSGRVRVTNLTGGPNNAVVTAETNGTLHQLTFPNNASQVLLGNGSFGPVPPGSNAWLLAGNGLTGSEVLGSTNGFPLRFITLNSEKMRIQVNGNVGIGTTAPAPGALLSVGNNNNLQVSPSGDLIKIKSLTYSWPTIQVGGVLTNNGLGGLSWAPAAGGGVTGTCPSGANFVAKWSSSTAITCSQIFDNGARVGIGTTTPNEQLEITGNFRLPASTASVGVIKSGPNRYIHNFGVDNFFAGVNAGNLTMTGVGNTAVGKDAFQSNTAGVQNVALGKGVLKSNTTGNDNTAVGTRTMESNTTGFNNTAVGDGTLFNNTTGTSNIALGASAGNNLLTGSSNIYIGNGGGTGAESNTIRIGNSVTGTRAFIGGIRGVTTGVANAIPVIIDSNGQLGTMNSSRRFKERIEDMGTASDVLYRLRPVSFLYKPEYGGRPDLPQFGLIAEEVANVAPELVAYDDQGKPYTVYYQFLAPMLLNELQKKDTEIGTLRARLDALEKLVEGLTKK